MKTNIKDKDIKPPFSKNDVDKLVNRMGITFSDKSYDEDDLLDGMKVELEHSGLTKGDASDTAMIALDHLEEDPRYYKKLQIMESDVQELSDEDFFSELEKEIVDAYSDKTAIASLINFANKADKLKSFALANSLDCQINEKTASIVDSIKNKIDKLRNRETQKLETKIETETGDSAIKVNPGIVVKDVFGKYSLYTTNAQIDEKIRKSHLDINDVIKAITAKLGQFGKKEEVNSIMKADFATRYNVARTMATQTGLLI